MSTLLYAQNRTPAPADEALVRSTTDVVQHDEAPATQEHPTDFNETFTDPVTDGGLTSRQLSSHVVPSARFVPNVDASAQDDHNGIINRQVSSSGTAAAKEATGQWGHGTLQIVEGIEPTIRDGGALGAHYFRTHERPLAGSGSYMTPAQASDPATTASAQQGAETNARAAVAQSMYGQMYANLQGGSS